MEKSNLENLSPEQKRALLAKLMAAKAGKPNPRLFKASRTQARLWFMNRLNPESPGYNLLNAYRIKGSLNEDALKKSLAHIVTRHESLRTTFAEKERQPVQVIHDQMSVALERVELNLPQGPELDAALEKWTLKTAKQPFDLEKGPLFRFRLLAVSRKEHVLLIALHHIISDNWSYRVINDELTLLYEAKGDPDKTTLPALTLQFKEYAAWEDTTFDEDAIEKQLSYWQETLAEMDITELRTDLARPAVQTYDGAVYRFEIPTSLKNPLKALGNEIGAGLYQVYMAAFQALLQRHTGKMDINHGAPISNRLRPESEAMVGFFINNLIVRTNLAGHPSFRETLRRVRNAMLGALEHANVPFDRLVKRLNRPRNLGKNPLYQIEFQRGSLPQLRLSGLEVNRFRELDYGLVRCDLEFFIDDSDDRFQGSMVYNTHLFQRETIQYLADHFLALLQEVAANPDQAIDGFPLITERERHLILSNWGHGRAEHPVQICLHHLFELHANQKPDAPALSFEGHTMSYGEVNRRANQIAHYLLGHGVAGESLVAVYLDRSFDMVISLLAILKTGAAYLPMDVAFPQERVTFVLADAAAPILITSTDQMKPGDMETPCLFLDQVDLNREGTENPNIAVLPHSLCYVIYTSGSTGKPKGVLITHANVLRLFYTTQAKFAFCADDCWTLFHSYAFDFATWEIWGALLMGGRLVIVPYLTSRNPTAYYDLVAREKVTILNQTPSAFRGFIEVDTAYGVELALRAVVFGGEALDFTSLRHWFAKHSAHGPAMINMYGITETTVHVTYYQVNHKEVIAPVGSNIGGPIPDLGLYILDPEFQFTPIGFPGELHISGAGLARGYLNRPALTAERFVPNPFSTQSGDRLYRTGDLGHFYTNGDVGYLGRLDHQVKIRGFRIELGEIEGVLNDHQAVDECLVLVRGETQLTAYAVPKPGMEINSTSLRNHLRTKLAEYMVPAHFVALDAFPLTGNGKIDRKALPDPDPSVSDTPYTEPRNETESKLAEIWQKVLGLDRIGIDDNFFDRGGDSLLSIRIIADARDVGLTLNLAQLFSHTTIRELTELLCSDKAGPEKTLVTTPFSLVPEADRNNLPSNLEDAYPATRLQAGMFFHSEADPGHATYHDIFSYEMVGPANGAAMKQTVELLIAKHEILRTSYDLTRFSEPLALVHRRIEVHFENTDLGALDEQTQVETLETWLEDEKNRPFDITRPGLLRVAFFTRGEHQFQLMLSFHHAILDGWSAASLFTELATIYMALIKDKAPVAAPLGIRFRDYVALEQEAVARKEAKTFWSRLVVDHDPARLSDAGEETELELQSRELAIPQQLFQRIQAYANSNGVPIKSVLLTAHLRVLSLFYGRARVTTGWVINGRPEGYEGEQLKGLHLNTLPFQIAVNNMSWDELVHKVFAQEKEQLKFRRYPLAQIQDDLGANELFESIFNYVHFHVMDALKDLDGLELQNFKGFEMTNYPLVTHFIRNKEGFFLMLNTKGVPHARAAAMADQYLHLLDIMTLEPKASVLAVNVLCETDRALLFNQWNSTEKDYPRQSIPHLFEAQVQRQPSALAVVLDDHQLTYADVWDKTHAVAAALAAKGIGPGKMVGLCLDRCEEMIPAMLAVLTLGAAYVPLDPKYPEARLRFMLENARAELTVTLRRLNQNISSECLCLRETNLDDRYQPDYLVPPDAPAYLCYTSGSTGTPKAVTVPHRGVARLLFGVDYMTLGPDKRFLQMAPVHFDAANLEIWGALLHGGTCVLYPDFMPTPEGIRGAIQKHTITSLWLTASLFNRVIDEDPHILDGVMEVAAGGEALSPLHVNRAVQALPHITVINGYGPTESTTFTCCYRIPSDWGTGFIPIGTPIANTRVYVLDTRLAPLPIGVPGELCIAGDGLALGYWAQPGRTARLFVPDPFGKGGRLYRSGDLVRYLADGRIQFLGRIDDQVKIRGFRIEIGEIEIQLNKHEGLESSTVMVKEYGPDDKRLIAYCLKAAESEVDADILRDYLREYLPDYMIPKAFLILDTYPLLPSGKLDRRALAAMEPGFDAGTYQPPQNRAEEVLAALYADILKVQKVGRDARFFDMGGNSLGAMRLLARIREAFSQNMPLSLLFEASDLADLAGRITGVGNVEAALPVAVDRTGNLPLSFAQQRLWFLYQLQKDSAFYNIPMAWRVQGKLDTEALAESVRAVVQRHEALHTHFVMVGDTAFQRVDPKRHFEYREHLLNQCEAIAQQEAARIISFEAERPFNLLEGPVFRAALISLTAQEHVLLVNFHHIVADGWSTGLFISEMAAFYHAVHTDTPVTLSELPLQYGDFAVWQKQYLSGTVYEDQLGYWRAKLDGAPTTSLLPLDHPRPKEPTYSGAVCSRILPSEQLKLLEAFSREEGATLFMTLLAAFGILLHRHGSGTDLLIGTPIANRAHEQLEGLIGFFANTLVMRIDLKGNPGFRQLLGRVRQTSLEAFSYQDMPFDKLVEELLPDRDQSVSPLFQTAFALQNAPSERLELPGLVLESEPIIADTAKFDLTMGTGETPEGFKVAVEFKTDLYEASTIEKLLDHFLVILQSLLDLPDEPILSLPMMTADEQAQLKTWGTAEDDDDFDFD